MLVVNTHLFYHPMASHIRMLQVAAILDEVRRVYGGHVEGVR